MNPAILSPAEAVAYWARCQPDTVAILDEEGRPVSYRALDELRRRAAGWLSAQGCTRGDVVALSLRNRLSTVVLILGAATIGCAISPINFRLTARERRPLLEQLTPSVWVYEDALESQAHPSTRDGAERAIPLSACLPAMMASAPISTRHAQGYTSWHDVFTVLWSSGSTGAPKGVVGSLAARWHWMRCLEDTYGIRPGDMFIAAMPLMHSAGLTFALAHLVAGATMRLLPRFDAARLWETVQTWPTVRALVVPTTLQWVLDAAPPATPPHLAALVCTGAKIPDATYAAARHRFSGVLYTYYGSTESPQMTILYPDEQNDHWRSVGRPFRFVEIGIRPVAEAPTVGGPVPAGTGEIVARNPSAMDRYLGSQDGPFDAEGWLHTGDLGFVDLEGYLHVVGRQSQMIISGGLNVFLGEIEDVIRQHAAVADAVAVGLDDAVWGQIPAVAVVRRPQVPRSGALSEDLLLWCRAQLADYKVPKVVAWLDEIPRNAAGKPMYAAVRALVDQHRQEQRRGG